LASSIKKLSFFEVAWMGLKNMEAVKKRKVKIKRIRSNVFDIIARGRGRFASKKIHLRCIMDGPSFPPKFRIVNAKELKDHPHLNDVYACLKVPWSPSSPLYEVVEAILKVWWYPK